MEDDVDEDLEEHDGPRPLTQIELDHLVAKFRLSQVNAEYMTTFLKKRKLMLRITDIVKPNTWYIIMWKNRIRLHIVTMLRV